MALTLKTVTVEGKTYAEVLDGKPVFVDDDNKEVAFDVPATVASINSRVEQTKRVEGENKELKDKLKAFEKIGDPDAALAALDKVKNIADGELIAAGKVEEIKAAARRTAEEQVAAANKANADKLAVAEAEIAKLQSDYFNEKIGGSFARSKFVNERMILPGPAVQKVFGDSFKIEDGKPVAYFSDGKKVFSRSKAGDVADFEEALEILVDGYPYRDSLLKGTGGGSGARGGNGGGAGQKEITRAAFDALPHDQRAAKMKDGVKVVD